MDSFDVKVSATVKADETRIPILKDHVMDNVIRCKLCGEQVAKPKYRLRTTTVHECSFCGFHFIDHLDEMPPLTDTDESVLDGRACRFIESMLPGNEAQHRKNLRFVIGCRSVSEACCLDIGAGAGVFPNLLREEGGEVSGIEPQKVFREFAEKKFGIQFRCEPVDHPFWQEKFSGYFDVISLWDVLEHVNFPAETLRDAFRLLKPGGWLFLDTPCRDSIFYLLSDLSYRLSNGKNTRMLESLYSPLPFRHKQLFNRRQLLDLLQRLGLVVEKSQSSRFTPQNKIVVACRKPA